MGESGDEPAQGRHFFRMNQAHLGLLQVLVRLLELSVGGRQLCGFFLCLLATFLQVSFVPQALALRGGPNGEHLHDFDEPIVRLHWLGVNYSQMAEVCSRGTNEGHAAVAFRLELGKVAIAREVRLHRPGTVVEISMDHPAARRWGHLVFDAVQDPAVLIVGQDPHPAFPVGKDRDEGIGDAQGLGHMADKRVKELLSRRIRRTGEDLIEGCQLFGVSMRLEHLSSPVPRHRVLAGDLRKYGK